MSYMPAQVKTEIFKLTETHPILTFLKTTPKIFPPKTKLKIKSYLFLKNLRIFWCSTVHTRSDYKPGIYSEFSAKTLPTWFNWGIIGVSLALLMIAFGTKSRRPIDLPRKSSKLSKRTVSMAIMVCLQFLLQFLLE